MARERGTALYPRGADCCEVSEITGQALDSPSGAGGAKISDSENFHRLGALAHLWDRAVWLPREGEQDPEHHAQGPESRQEYPHRGEDDTGGGPLRDGAPTIEL